MASSVSGISFAGIASGLDSTSIIKALLGVRHKPIDVLQARKDDFGQIQAHLSHFRDLVSSLRDASDELNSAAQLLAFHAASSSESVLSASANGSASAGSFVVNVGALATAAVEASSGFADADTTSVGTGTISITVGGTTKSITIATGQDTLSEIQKAINDAGVGATATVVNAGTGTTPYQLVLTGDHTGEDNTVTVDLSAFTGTLSFTEKQPATNATLSVNGITVERASNQVSDLVEGVTLTLNNIGASTVTVSADTQKIHDKVQKYVSAYNDLVNFANSEMKYDENAKHAGPLGSESSVRGLMSQLSNAQSASGYPGGTLTVMSQIGIKSNSDGTLNFDTAKFDTAVNNGLDDVTALLTTLGDKVSGVGFSLKGVPDTLAPGTYAVNVTQAATKAQLDIGSAFAGGGTLAAAETLTITSGTSTVNVSLAIGDDLTAALGKINTALGAAGVHLSASDNGGAIRFKSADYGSAQSFTVISDVASGAGTSGVGNSVLNGTGLDVQGTVGGIAATGAGQTLTGTGTFKDVALNYVGTNVPSNATLTVGADGFFVKMKAVLDHAANAADGSLTVRLNGIATSMTEMQKHIDDQENRLNDYADMLKDQFSKLEAVIGKLQASQSFLNAISTQKFGFSK